ncbi:MAG: alpha/beta fold hydrolase [Saprospiraceae bacterium]|nr:alpha/beta fold hydrolase [Candidatus Brachybacter algidus]
MNILKLLSFFIIIFCADMSIFAQSDSLVLKDLVWDNDYPAGTSELFIPSASVLLAGMIYKPNGNEKHPTLILLHGFPGNEKNLDLAQVVRAHGWNVIYFNYRGAWGSQGKFSFKNCVEDAVNVVTYCNKYQDSLKIDTSNIVLFGHSMGGWVCLKSLEQLPQIKKGFALSTWNIYGDLKTIPDEKKLIEAANNPDIFSNYFVLNSNNLEIFLPAFKELSYYKLATDAKSLSKKEIIMLDEHTGNIEVADSFKEMHLPYFDYQIWKTDHGFTNKRVSLMNKLISFLDQ